MDILYIFGIAILLMGGTDSLIEEKNLQQRILLRKLQTFEETKPTTWNEVLADVLVNKIRIFSFTTEDKEPLKDDAPVSKENPILTDFFSKLFVVYKKFIYDAFVGKRKTSDGELVHITTIPETIKDKLPKMDPEELIRPTEVIYAEGPKSEVELVEPRYHGKIALEDTPENPSKEIADQSQEDNTNTTTEVNSSEVQGDSDMIVSDPGHQQNVDPGLKKSDVNCAEGFVKSDGGDCVKNASRLILAIPNQCPLGYRKDWLGYCRKTFHF